MRARDVLAVLLVVAGCSERATNDNEAMRDAGDEARGPNDAPAASSTARVCVPGKQDACACPGSEITGVQICKVDGSGYGSCVGCPDSGVGDGPRAGMQGSMDGAMAGAGGGEDAGVMPAADPLACVQTDLGERDEVARDVVGPASYVYRWQPSRPAVYVIDGTDGDDKPLVTVRREDCNHRVSQELTGRAPIIASLEAGAPLVIAVTWAADSRTTLQIAEIEQASCSHGQVDCGAGCVTLANSDVDCGCNGAICASDEGKKTECVPGGEAPYATCSLRDPVECDEGLMLCGDECVSSPPAGYGLCSGKCVDITSVDHCGSACSDCSSMIAGSDPVACVATGSDYECKSDAECPAGEVDCGAGCVRVVGEACGCEPVCCQTWTGAMTCQIEGGDAVCRSKATNAIGTVPRNECVERGTLPP